MYEFDDELSNLLATVSVGRTRLSNALAWDPQGGNPITTMPQLLAQTRTDLLRRRMFGRKCLARLEQALAEHGLHLADNVSQPLHEQNWASGMLSELG